MKTIIYGMATAILLAAGSSALAQDISTTPTIDPANGQYVVPGQISYNVPGAGPVMLGGMVISGLQPAGLPVNVGDTLPAQSFFDVFVDVSIPSLNTSGPFVGTGPSDATDTIIQRLTGLGGPGTFNTQMTQLDMSLGNGLFVRIDPQTPSTGQTTIEDIGAGEYKITSFFDIFTDISLDGGNTWTPSTGPAVMTLESTPEPSTLALVGTGIAGLLAFRRRNKI